MRNQIGAGWIALAVLGGSFPAVVGAEEIAPSQAEPSGAPPGIPDSAATSGHAYGNTTKGRLAIREDSDLSLSTSTALRGCCSFTTTFALSPSVDYFLYDGLAIGASVSFGFAAAPGAQVLALVLSPRLGYNLALTDMLSVWPQVSVGIGFTSANGVVNATLPIDLYVPVYFHLVENFFFGVGPAVSLQPLDNTAVFSISILRFSIGGSIDLAAE